MGIFDKIKSKINEIEQSNAEYQNKIDHSTTITNLNSIEISQEKDISPNILTSKNPNITEEKAKLIINLLPLNEIYLEVLYGSEIKTKKEYFIVPTTKYLWIMSKEGYIKFEYTNLKAEIIKKSLLTKTINISNYIFEISNTDEEINNFINIINNIEYRTNLINKEIEIYGDNETYRILNKIGSGISYDSNQNIRFYSKNINKKYNINDLENYELYMDNNVLQEKRLKQNARLTATKNSCYEIKIRITPKDNNVFEIPILEKDTMSQLYSSTSDTYIRNLEFAKKIMKILDEINEELIYGKK